MILFITDEVAQYYIKLHNGSKCQNALLKLETYDRLKWTFLDNILAKFDFSNGWLDRVMALVRNVSYKVRINGELSDRVIPEMDLRQGDPLSQISLHYFCWVAGVCYQGFDR